jgi:hypothetical protein
MTFHPSHPLMRIVVFYLVIVFSSLSSFSQNNSFVQFYRDSFFIAKNEDFDRIEQLELNSFDSTTAALFCNKLAELGTYVDPTLVIAMTERWKKRLTDQNVLSTKDVPAELAAWFGSKKEIPSEDDLDFDLFRDKLKMIRYFKRANVKLLAGTDMSAIHRPAVGYSLHDELEFLLPTALRH